MKIKKSDLISTYAQSIGIETAKELISKKIKSAALEEKENYTEEETAKICGELIKEGGLIRIVAQNFVVQLERKKSEEQALLLDNIETQIWYLTDKETYGVVNKAHAEFLGLEKEKLEGRDLYDIISVEEAEVCIANNREVFEKKKQSHTEEWVKNGRGETRLLSITRTPKLDGKGDVEYVICAAEDITERKKAEEKIKEADIIINKSPAVAFTWKNEEGWPIEYVSENVKKLFGYSTEDFLSRKISYAECVYLDDLERVEQEVADFSKEEEREEFVHEPYRILTKDNNVKVVKDWTFIVRDFEGKITHYKGIIEDITERKKAEEALRESEERFRTIVETAPSLLIITDAVGNNLYVSPNCEEITGYTQEELRGEPRWWMHEDDTRRALELFECTFREGIGYKNFEYKIVKKNGEVRHASSSWKPLKDGEGKFKGIVFQTIDITERKQAEERIEHLNSVLKAIRKVNQLITREKDRNMLLQSACDNLIKTRGYYNAWIALIDESGSLVTTAEAGLGKDFLPMVERLKRGKLTDCGQKARMQLQVVATEDPFSTCADCPLSDKYHDRGALTVRLEYGKKVYGLLSVSIPKELTADKEEQNLFKEVAGDLAFALYRIDLEEEEKRAEEKVKEAYRLREHFLKETSHRIITPVAIIGGNTDLLLESSNLDDAQKDKIMIIRERNAEVQKLVRDALAGKYLEEEEGGEG